MEQHLYAWLPNGTEHDFGPDNAKRASSLPPVERDILVGSLVVTEMIGRVGAGNVGQFLLRYEIRAGTADRAAADSQFVAAGHRPEDAGCNHQTYNAAQHGRYCPSCGTCMWDAGD